MKSPRPSYKELVASLGTLLAEYAAIDEMLDDFSGAALAGATAAEKRAQRTSNSTRNRIQRVYVRAVTPTTAVRQKNATSDASAAI
jgi:hypothetical protein